MRPVLMTALLLTLVSAPVAAQVGEFVAEETDAVASGSEAEKTGWQFGLTLGASLSYTHNSHVVGAQEGSTFQFGLLLDGLIAYFGGAHEWVNTLKVRETVSKTPSVDLFLKTQDEFDLSSTYSYHPVAIPWLGPFARFRLQSSIFPGWDAKGEGTYVQRSDNESADPYERIDAQEKLNLTDWFEPLTLRQIVGAFATPVEREAVKLTFTLGLGVQEVFTRGGYTLGDTTDIDIAPNDGDKTTTPVTALRQLNDYQQLGGDFEMNVSGKIGDYITWGATAGLFQPLYSSLDRGKQGVELLEVLINGKLSVKLASWLSLDYVLSVKRLPLITDDWQVQNALLLTAGFDIF